ncbi:IS200/IS605 family accessory protein TnpB-related protein [Blautia producta]|uniref:IS200/IS605 family accessory protein TnpB-related protein n=1 Tax=Blautia producta TaxID=33035 RepID=UPI0035632BD4
MNLTIRKPEENVKLDSSRALGIKLGEHITVNSFINSRNKFLIGNAEELLRMRTQLACQRSRIQSNLRYTKGGRGRNNKLKAYERLSKREKAFVKNFNHNISRQIVNYALKNRCACIVMEDFNGYDDEKNKFPYERWTYYDLQEMIKYKAAGYGIKVIREPVTLADFKTDMDIAKYLAGVTDAKK